MVCGGSWRQCRHLMWLQDRMTRALQSIGSPVYFDMRYAVLELRDNEIFHQDERIWDECKAVLLVFSWIFKANFLGHHLSEQLAHGICVTKTHSNLTRKNVMWIWGVGWYGHQSEMLLASCTPPVMCPCPIVGEKFCVRRILVFFFFFFASPKRAFMIRASRFQLHRMWF